MRGRKSLQDVAYALFLLTAIILLFFWYTSENSRRMEERNKSYAADSARSTAVKIDEELNNALDLITTYVYFIEDGLTEPTITLSMLDKLVEHSLFDVLLFTDSNGIDHISDGRTSDVSDRTFYLDGMNGGKGTDIIFDPHFFNEIMACFYAPIHYDGEIIGVLRGAYLAEEYLHDMLNITYFGEQAGLFLCTPDGRVIAGSDDNERTYEGNLIDILLQNNVIDEHTATGAKDIFANGGEGAFLCDSGSLTDNLCVTWLPNHDFVLVQTFPKNVTQLMIRDENLVGIRLEIVLLLLFAIYVVLLLFRARQEKKLLEQENHDVNSLLNRKERQYRIAITSNAFCTFEFNLTKDMIENDIVHTANGKQISLLEPVGLKAPCHASECFEKWKAFVLEESIDEYSSMVNTAYLQERFDQGDTQIDVDYWGQASAKQQMCVRQSFIMTKDDKTGDIMVMVVSKEITEQVQEQKAQRQALQDALMQAQHANNAKTTFLSNMSHDIRTPMNAIIGFTTIAVSHIDNKEQVKDCLQKVLSSSNHLLSLINDILDMSRIESGKVQIKEQECNISELMHNLVNIIQPQVKAKQLELFIDTFEVVNEDVIADALKMNQVFINLLSNAVKYTPAGGTITFRIMQKTTFRHGYGDYIFTIKDTGIGMSEEFVKHIFEPFERETTVTRSGIQGTGLGMAITKNIVEMMNGKISVESEVGKGSTFTVEFSLKLQDVDKNVEQLKELEGLRALVVDDDFNICESVSMMLQQLGIHAEWTTSGKEAAYRAKTAHEEGNSYHTYIIDWQMPEMSGLETTRKIRSLVGNEVPIIILTAYDWSDIEEDAKAAGVTGFCAKPLFMSDLKSALLAANNPTGRNEQAAAWTLADFGGKRVLLVEDIELNREIAEMILTEAGFVVESAPDGTDAVAMMEKAEENYYDVVLMDIQMPVMNGYEATRIIRNMPRNDVKDLPIIAMTANALEEDKEAALKNGMNAHIAKPIDMDVFISVLEQFVH